MYKVPVGLAFFDSGKKAQNNQQQKKIIVKHKLFKDILLCHPGIIGALKDRSCRQTFNKNQAFSPNLLKITK